MLAEIGALCYLISQSSLCAFFISKFITFVKKTFIDIVHKFAVSLFKIFCFINNCSQISRTSVAGMDMYNFSMSKLPGTVVFKFYNLLVCSIGVRLPRRL